MTAELKDTWGPPHKFISHSCGDPPREDEKALHHQSICLMFQSPEAFECCPLPSSAVYQSRLNILTSLTVGHLLLYVSTNQPSRQPGNQPSNQPVNKPACQPTNQLANQRTRPLSNQPPQAATLNPDSLLSRFL